MNFTPDTVSTRLGERGTALSGTAHPRALLRPWRRSGGIVGADMTVDEARTLAETCLLNLLFHVRAACGGRLDRVACWLWLGGFVAAVPGFADAPFVINAASDPLIRRYGAECGAHDQTAIAVAGLPGGAPVDIDAMLEMMP